MAERLAKHAGLKAVWDPKRRDDLHVLLTATSDGIETLQEDGTATTRKTVFDKLTALKLDDAYKDLASQIAIGGALPEDFSTALRQYLSEVKSSPHLGVWKAPTKPGDPSFDFSALAAWVNRADPAYLREHIAARSKGGTSAWDRKVTRPVHRWLAWEEVAFAWLERQLGLEGVRPTPAEAARIKELSHPLFLLFRQYDCHSGEEVVAISGHQPCTGHIILDHSGKETKEQTVRTSLVICKASVDNDAAAKELLTAGCTRGGAPDGRGIDFCCPVLPNAEQPKRD